MINLQPVSIDLHHEVSQFLYKEARILDRELVRDWLTDMVDSEICYRTVITEERFRKNKSPVEKHEVLPYDDNMAALQLRARQFETGLQSMMNPPQRLCRSVTNIEAFHSEIDGEYLVLSHGIVSRFRRQYEREQLVYTREDILKRGTDGAFRLLKRRVDLPERVVRNKNLLFFL